MLQDTITNVHLKLFCLVDGESTPNAFPLTIPSSETVGELRKLIKVEKAPEFDDIAADKLTLWSTLIPDRDNDEGPILLDATSEKTKLKATTKLSKVFTSELPDDTIHIIVQRPPGTDPNARTSINVRVEGNSPRPRAAPQGHDEHSASVSSSSWQGSAESQDRSPQSTPQNNGSSSRIPTEANSNLGSEGSSLNVAHVESGDDSQNDHEALRLLLRDGNQGNVDAQRKLGFIYKHGQGVPEDYTKALEWFQKAGDQGDVDSLVALAFMKKNGQGGSKNFGRFLEFGGKAIGQVVLKGHRFW
ncbi:hypothetical protein EC957_010703 [Mortierella hygrophila]|uniref:Crinkler effector protein N-terminal domain-containing protein n=1 Tax=Mortierella hygrophila TaxID=979708 RepID=A0A9P6F9K2_9FUNG|nr:hypothetical protein EC957_010703 [Mortierella hygrophila]